MAVVNFILFYLFSAGSVLLSLPLYNQLPPVASGSSCKLVLVIIMDVSAEIQKLTTLGKDCGLEGKELLEFVCAERERLRNDNERVARDERAHQLELRRHDKEKIELQVKLETAKRSSVSSDSGNGHSRLKARAPKLPAFNEALDDLDAYLQRFERYAVSQEWDTEEWAVNLSALLKGKALEVYSRLSLNDVSNYDTLKDALLKRFHLTEHGFRVNFRTVKPERGETAPQFSVRLDNLLTRWVDMARAKKSYDGLKDLFLREQFLNSCNDDLATFLKERKPPTVQEMARYAEQYSEAHGGFGDHLCLVRKQPAQTAQRPTQQHFRTQSQQPRTYPSRAHAPRFDRAGPHGAAPSHLPSTNYSKPLSRTCYLCHKPGHFARECPHRNARLAKVATAITSALVEVLTEDPEVESSSETFNESDQRGNQGTEATPFLSPETVVPF